MKQWTIDVTAFVLRLAAGLIFLPHGWGKVFGAGGAATFAQDMPSYGLPVFLGYAAAYAELFCAVLLIAGLLTRLDALLLGCTMFVATFVVQLPDALRDPQGGGNKLFAALHGIELPLALLAICLALMLLGAGRFSLDSLLRVDARVTEKLGRRRVGIPAPTTLHQ
jgi:putative oxidoreductase